MIFYITISIFINLFYNKIIIFLKIFYNYINSQKEYRNIENCLKLSLYIKRNQEKFIKKIYYPKISIISPFFNSERYIKRFLSNIQYQNYNNIEIILVDDNSIDNGRKMIEEYKKKDERIILLQNQKNIGTFACRNLGVLFSRGKYIIIPDPDDIISTNILKICYNYAEKKNFELIRFNTYLGNNRVIFNDIYLINEKNDIYQPELSTYIFYETNELKIVDFYITNKLIKKELYIRALNYLNNFYLKLYNLFGRFNDELYSL